MPTIRTLFCLVDIKKRSFLTSCVFWFIHFSFVSENNSYREQLVGHALNTSMLRRRKFSRRARQHRVQHRFPSEHHPVMTSDRWMSTVAAWESLGTFGTRTGRIKPCTNINSPFVSLQWSTADAEMTHPSHPDPRWEPRTIKRSLYLIKPGVGI